jgi:hypothetical protein
VSWGYAIATRAFTVSSSISRDSAPGTNVVATPTRHPARGGFGVGRRITGNNHQRHCWMATW